MSRGLGRIQRECLRVIAGYEAGGVRPTTFNVAADVYHVEHDADGSRMINDAQHVATKRALATLRRKGLVTGQQDMGRTQMLADGSCTGYAERCCLWSIAVTNSTGGGK
jgi:hypothetical protein